MYTNAPRNLRRTATVTIGSLWFFALLCSKAESDTNSPRKGDRVRAAIQHETPLPSNATNRLHSLGAVDLDRVAKKWGLAFESGRMDDEGAFVSTFPCFKANPSGTNRKGVYCPFYLVEGKRGSADALDGLFEIMERSTSRPITPDRWIIAREGAGDFCIQPSHRKLNEVDRGLVFIRDNIGVILLGPHTNLLALARDVDAAILASPISNSSPRLDAILVGGQSKTNGGGGLIIPVPKDAPLNRSNSLMQQKSSAH